MSEEIKKSNFSNFLEMTSGYNQTITYTLCDEIDSVSYIIEKEISELSSRFFSLAQAAASQAESVKNIAEITNKIVINGKEWSLTDITHSLDETLMNVVESIVKMSREAMKLVYTLEEVVQKVDKVDRFVNQIDEITRQTHMLSINAAIESTNAGEIVGAPFAVIAKEVRELSWKTKELAQEMRSEMGDIAEGVRNGYRILNDYATIDMSEHIFKKSQLDEMMVTLSERNALISSMLNDAHIVAEQVSSNIRALVIDLQFQDRARQHLDNVVLVLKMLNEEIDYFRNNPEETENLEFINTYINKIVDKFFLSEMKNRMKHALGLSVDNNKGEEGKENPSSPTENIELF